MVDLPESHPGSTEEYPLRPWSFVFAFGFVSLFADMVYEGARSIIGPYLALLGASATLVGLVAGAGELIGYGLRLASAYLVTRTRHYWLWTIAGYTLTVLSVPLIGVGGGLLSAMLLYAGERLGKAVRSPAKDTLLSHASTATGRGKAFGVHQFMDQLGAVAGPLLLAAMLAWHPRDYRLAFAALGAPGLAVLAILLWLRARVPDPRIYEFPAGATRVPRARAQSVEPASAAVPRALPARFWQYVAAVAVLSSGMASFPLLAYHAQTRHLVSDAMVPVLFAVAMLVDGLTGLLIGHAYDRRGPTVLLAVPIAACGAALAFADSGWLVWLGVAIWGVVSGILDSTVKAAVTELVPSAARALAFGWLSLARGLGLLVAGGLLGVAYDHSIALTVTLILVANAAALAGLLRVVLTLGRVPRAV
ncbi:MAG TPA: MFS transporter [Polyangiaceae bacterium]|nr:MFS transporter [Polyangiaceae bacterium]